ncbi:MAG: RnfABCDGE type electron transport complex subunit B [Firmicutes bacterium]|nr:RnfABCDGE type electron transport complex subunit B [Bacillota bacterium]
MDIFLPILIPVLIFLVAGGAIGFGLSFLGEKLKIERDPRIDDVLRFLPGINCGGCGSAGCDSFAKKLVAGEADVSSCNPCSPQNRENIGKRLGRNVENSRPTVAVVHCNGGNRCRNKYSYQGYGDCRAAEMIAGGAKACTVACLGLSSCVSACKYGAAVIDKDKAVSVVLSENCTSCGACVSACPKKIISRIPVDAKVYIACSNPWKGKDIRPICPVGCIACGRCEKECPEHAIEVSNNLAMIDYDKCTGCGRCVTVCPSKCILPYEYKGECSEK